MRKILLASVALYGLSAAVVPHRAGIVAADPRRSVASVADPGILRSVVIETFGIPEAEAQTSGCTTLSLTYGCYIYPQAVLAVPQTLPPGTGVAPALAFKANPATGLYNSGDGGLSFTVGGLTVGEFTSSGLTVNGTIALGAASYTTLGVSGVLTLGTAAVTGGVFTNTVWTSPTLNGTVTLGGTLNGGTVNSASITNSTFVGGSMSGVVTLSGTLTGGTINALVSGSTVTQPTVGASTRSLQAILSDSINVISAGADPNSVADGSTIDQATFVQTALSQAAPNGHLKNAYMPAGTYHFKSGVTLSQDQCLVGDGRNTTIDINSDLAPSLSTTGVITIVGNGKTPALMPCVIGIHFLHHWPLDMVTTAAAAAATGAGSVVLATSAAALGVQVGDYIVDVTTPAAIIRNSQFNILPGTVVTGIVNSNTVSISNTIVAGSSVGLGDTLDFAHPRSSFAPLGSCSTTIGGSGCLYPYDIFSNTVGMVELRSVLFEGAYHGISLFGNASQGGGNTVVIDDIQIGALADGLSLGNIYNFGYLDHYTSWIWGFVNEGDGGGGPAFGQNFYDGVPQCANLGETDGITIPGIECFSTALNLTSGWTWGHFGSVAMDNNGAVFTAAGTINSPATKIDSFYSTKGQGFLTQPSISSTSGTVVIGKADIANSTLANGISVTGGNLYIGGYSRLLNSKQGGGYFAVVSSGTLSVEDSNISSNSCVGNNLGSFLQSGTGALRLVNNQFTGNCAEAAVQISADVAGNLIVGNTFNTGLASDYGATLPAGVAGIYGPNASPAINTRVLTTGTNSQEKLYDQSFGFNVPTGGAKSFTLYGCTSLDAGKTLTVSDMYGDAGTNPISVSASAGTINGHSLYLINTNNGSVTFTCSGSGWTAPPAAALSGANPFIGLTSTGFFLAPSVISQSAITPVASHFAGLPVYVSPSAATVKSMSIDITAAPGTAYSWEGCLYKSDTPSGSPGSLVSGGDTTLVTTGTASGVVTATLPTPVSLPPGWYWEVIGVTGTVAGTLQGGNANQVVPWQTVAYAFDTENGIYTTGTFGALGSSNCPTSFTTVGATTAVPVGVLGF